LLPEVGVNHGSPLSVLHHVSGSRAHLEAFLESLKRQQIPAAPEVILVFAADRSDHAAFAHDLLPRYFPETGRIVRDPERADRAQRLQAAAATAQGQFLLFVGDHVILHDARTLLTLLTLAHYQRAASASCLMIATDGPGQSKRMKLVSGGYYRHEAFSGADAKSNYVGACADLAALPPATWPVAANDPRILMVRSDVWRKLSGSSAAGGQTDLDYAARAVMAGYSHYCTSAISVTLLGDVAGSAARAAAPLSPAPRAGTVLRRLVS
jgi:Glycosyl transferase family 2